MLLLNINHVDVVHFCPSNATVDSVNTLNLVRVKPPKSFRVSTVDQDDMSVYGTGNNIMATMATRNACFCYYI